MSTYPKHTNRRYILRRIEAEADKAELCRLMDDHGLRCASCRLHVLTVFEQHGGDAAAYERALIYLSNQRPH